MTEKTPNDVLAELETEYEENLKKLKEEYHENKRKMKAEKRKMERKLLEEEPKKLGKKLLKDTGVKTTKEFLVKFEVVPKEQSKNEPMEEKEVQEEIEEKQEDFMINPFDPARKKDDVTSKDIKPIGGRWDKQLFR